MAGLQNMDPQMHERQATCDVHGEFTQRGGSFYPGQRIMWFSCPECSKLERAAEEVEKARKEEDARQKRIEAKLNTAGIPLAFRSRTFDNFKADTDEQRYALDLSREFAENFWSKHYKAGSFMVFGGEPGTGKSHLAIATTPAVLARGTAMYVRASDVIRRVRATWRRDSEQSEEDVLHMLGYEIDLLIIDEVGVQRGTEDEQMILFDVIDRRYAELLPTILLTNLSGKVFAEFLGPRIMDRLRERSVFVPFRWDSYRARQDQ